MDESSCSLLLNHVQCFLSGLALYNKYKCYCAEFITDMDPFDFDCWLSFYFFYCSKENIRSIGINSDNIWNSIGLGFAGGFLLLGIQTALFMIQGKSISFTSPRLLNWVIFLFAAFEEEVLFRGYIQTRLFGLINSQWIVGIINSVLFLSIHYPVKWVVSGTVSFDVLSAVYIVSLLALHFLL